MVAREGKRKGGGRKDGEMRKACHMKLYTVIHILSEHIVSSDLQLTPLMNKSLYQSLAGGK